jgi:Catalase
MPMGRPTMPGNGYLLYEPSVEQIAPGEQQAIQAITQSIDRTKVNSVRKLHYAIRQQHAKGQGFLKGELTVYRDLPDHLRQGLFAAARTYPIIVRLSTALGDIRSDRVRVPRGMAIKVLGVDGARALPEEDRSANQDFLLVNRKAYVSNAAAYWNLQRTIECSLKAPDLALRGAGWVARGVKSLFGRFGFPSPLPPAFRGLAETRNNLLGETFHSMAAIRFGLNIAKVRAVPTAQTLRKLAGRPIDPGDNGLCDFVVEFFRSNAAEYELCAQLCTDLRRMPVEDSSVEWPEDVSAPQPIARISLPCQQADSPQRRAYADDVLSFNPWRCLADHQPLGSIMRLRKQAYRTSSDFRNGKGKEKGKPMIEPRDISEFPD